MMMSKPPNAGGTLSNTSGMNGANPNSPDGYTNFEQEEVDPKILVERRLQESIKEAEAEYEKFTLNDKMIKRKDTVEVVIDILTKVKNSADEINKMSQDMREKLYYLTFNCTVIIFKICH